jgi:hypothetical protein
MRAKKQSYFRRRFPIGKVEFHSNNLRDLGGQFALKGDARSVALAKVFRLHLVARAVVSGVAYPLAAGAGGTGRMISEATFQALPTFIQFMIIRNGLGVPSCPA